MSATADRGELTVVVPAPDSSLQEEVRTGSGMVASSVGATGRLRVDFEGDAELFPTFADRVQRATERHTWHRPHGSKGYPTSACAYVNPEEVKAIGTFNPSAGRIAVSDSEKLKNWLHTDRLPPEELTLEGAE